MKHRPFTIAHVCGVHLLVENAQLMRDLLAGVGGPLREVVLLNSGAALIVAGRVTNVEAGIELAAKTLDSGAARRVLEELITRTNAPVRTEAIAE